jgi:hypothetical protein
MEMVQTYLCLFLNYWNNVFNLLVVSMLSKIKVQKKHRTMELCVRIVQNHHTGQTLNFNVCVNMQF